MKRTRILRPTLTPVDRARLQDVDRRRKETTAQTRVRAQPTAHVLNDAEVKTRLANVTVQGWDRTVLGTVVQLGGNAHDEAILKTLRRAGHPSLTEAALRRALGRLEEHGLLRQERATRGEGKRARTLRFWVSAV